MPSPRKGGHAMLAGLRVNTGAPPEKSSAMKVAGVNVPPKNVAAHLHKDHSFTRDPSQETEDQSRARQEAHLHHSHEQALSEHSAPSTLFPYPRLWRKHTLMSVKRRNLFPPSVPKPQALLAWGQEDLWTIYEAKALKGTRLSLNIIVRLR